MKSWLFAGAALLLASSALAPAALAEGPRASSENHWPGMTQATADQLAATPASLTQAEAAQPQPTAPHYVWQEGYENGGRWVGHWELVR